MTRGPVREEMSGRIETLDERFPRRTPWPAIAGIGIIVVAEVADAVRDVAAAIREARS